jgi:hypothetical protein
VLLQQLQIASPQPDRQSFIPEQKLLGPNFDKMKIAKAKKKIHEKYLQNERNPHCVPVKINHLVSYSLQ